MMRLLLIGLSATLVVAPATVHAQAAATCTFEASSSDVAAKAAALEHAARTRQDSASSFPKAAADALIARAAELRIEAADLRTTATSLAVTNTLKVEHGPRRVAIHLANPPPTRMRLSFDGSKGQHHEVEWDPAVASELTRAVSLGEDTWRVVASVEPSTYTQNAGSVIIHTRFGGAAKASTTSWTLEGTYIAMIAALTAPATASERELTLWPRPQLMFQCSGPPAMESSRFATTAGANVTSGVRGFGTAPTLVTDTLALVAEIAVERAKSGAMRLLKRRLIEPFCSDDDTKVTLAKLGLGHSDDVALPRTCELLKSLRLEDILASGRPLLIALRDDLRRTIAPATIAKLAGPNGFAQSVLQALLSVIDTSIDRGGIDALDGQFALETLGNLKKLAIALAPQVRQELGAALAAKLTLAQSEVDTLVGLLGVTCTGAACKDAVLARVAELVPFGNWPALGDALRAKLRSALVGAIEGHERARMIVAHGCQARLAVATIKRCHRDGCSVHDVAGMLATPQDHFAVDETLPYALCWTAAGTYRAAPNNVASIQQLVIDGLRVVGPVVDTTGRERAKAVVRVMVGLLQRWESSADPATCKCVDAFAEIALALIDEDYGTALVRFVRLAEKLQPGKVPKPVGKLAQLIGAVAAYAAVHRDTKDADPAAARAARKEALTSIIDSATDRSERDADWIVSLGSNVGMSATWSDAFNTHAGGTQFEPSLRVPLGIALDSERVGPFGFRGGLQLVDLGQFVRRGSDDNLDEVGWSDFVSPGAELGVSFPFLDRALNLSVHAAYAPSISGGDAGDGVWRYGVSLGYYVPLFDLN